MRDEYEYLKNMNVHDTYDIIKLNLKIIRIPNGWIYKYCKNNSVICFVPENNKDSPSKSLNFTLDDLEMFSKTIEEVEKRLNRIENDLSEMKNMLSPNYFKEKKL